MFIKYKLVDDLTGLPLADGQPNLHGLRHPHIAGLDAFLPLDNNYFIAEVPNGTIIPGNLGAVVLSNTDLQNIIGPLFDKIKTNIIDNLYQHAQALRSNVIDPYYHSSELSFAIAVKHVEAPLALAASTDVLADAAAPTLAIEAAKRGITTKQLAQKVVDNFTALKNQEANLAGIRGKKVDVVMALTFDVNNVRTSLNALLQQTNQVQFGWN